MDHQRVDARLDGYRRAREQADSPAVLGLFTTADQRDVRVRFGDPVVDGDRVAVEWWTTTLEEGRPSTLIGTSLLTFTPDGLVAAARDYWFLEPGTHQPFEGWGH